MIIRSSEAAKAVRGRLVGVDNEFDGVSFDSRTTKPGEAFVALVGERDGHDFLDDASRIARVLITRRDARPASFGGSSIEVDDTAQALLDLGRHARSLLTSAGTRVVGITGSVGKTSTKDFTSAALRSTLANVVASPKSFNNDIGVPVTLLSCPTDVDAVVLEMAMRGPGEIERLCGIARPHIGVVTRVGEAHTDRVGGIEGVARAKSELVRALDSDGVAVLNADDERVIAMSSLCKGRVVTFGVHSDATIRVRPTAQGSDGRITAEASVEGVDGRVSFQCPVPGVHMLANAAAALAVSHVVGVSLADACRGIQDAHVSDGRMRQLVSRTGAVVIDDSYNANPTSVEAALRTLAALKVSRKVAVLGVMAEIADAQEAHERIARLAHELGIRLVSFGTAMYNVDPKNIDEIVEELSTASDDTAVLVKGSRVAQLERVVRGLVG